MDDDPFVNNSEFDDYVDHIYPVEYENNLTSEKEIWLTPRFTPRNWQ